MPGQCRCDVLGQGATALPHAQAPRRCRRHPLEGTAHPPAAPGGTAKLPDGGTVPTPMAVQPKPLWQYNTHLRHQARHDGDQRLVGVDRHAQALQQQVATEKWWPMFGGDQRLVVATVMVEAVQVWV